MKLFEYLEYLTVKEKINAFNNGQSNLNQSSISSTINSEIINFKKDKIKFLKSEDGEDALNYIVKNKTYPCDIARYVLLYDGNYYFGDAYEVNHYLMIQYIFFDSLFSFFNYELDNVEDWESNAKCLNKFICLTKSKNNDVYLADSYRNGNILNVLYKNKKLIRHYQELCKNKLNLNLIIKAK